jgi:hypothetical protein
MLLHTLPLLGGCLARHSLSCLYADLPQQLYAYMLIALVSRWPWRLRQSDVDRNLTRLIELQCSLHLGHVHTGQAQPLTVT